MPSKRLREEDRKPSSMMDNEYLYIDGPQGVGALSLDALKNSKTNLLTITYAQLVIAIARRTLIPGSYYNILDYQTTYRMPNDPNNEVIAVSGEGLIVLATSNETLSPLAYSEVFPNDLIFYHVTNDQDIVPGCTTGYISRRIDTKYNIDLPYDWRNVVFRRWQLNVMAMDVTGAVSNYTKGNVVVKTGTTDIYIKLNDAVAKPFTDLSAWLLFTWKNGDFVSPTWDYWTFIDDSFTINIPVNQNYHDRKAFAIGSVGDNGCYSIAVLSRTYDIINGANVLFSDNCCNIRIGVNSTNVIFNSNCSNINIGNSCFHLILGKNCSDVSFGDEVASVYLGVGSHIIFGSGCSTILIGDENMQVRFDSGCNNIIIAGTSQNISYDLNCNNIFIGQNCEHIKFGMNDAALTLGSNCQVNEFGINVVGITFGNGLMYNKIADDIVTENGIDLTTATKIYDSSNKFWFKTLDATIKLYYFSNTTFALTVVDISV